MKSIESVRKEIVAAEAVLNESIEHLKKNPDDYSAKLLVLSTENYLSDLLRALDLALMTREPGLPISGEDDFSQ